MAATDFQIIEATEGWTDEGASSVFKETNLFLRQGDSVFAVKTTKREFELDDLELASLERVLVPAHDFCPEYKDSLTKAPTPLPEGSYVKQPKLFYWDANDGGAVAANFLREAEAYETIKQAHLHPSHAVYVEKYYGCVVENGRITGLCLKKYETSLEAAMEAETVPEEKRREWANGITTGIKILVWSGLAHNDVNPSNIMMDGEKPVLVNFGDCRPAGEKLAEPRTAGLLPEWVETSEFENDLYGLKKIMDRVLRVKMDGRTGEWAPFDDDADSNADSDPFYVANLVPRF